MESGSRATQCKGSVDGEFYCHLHLCMDSPEATSYTLSQHKGNGHHHLMRTSMVNKGPQKPGF